MFLCSKFVSEMEKRTSFLFDVHLYFWHWEKCWKEYRNSVSLTDNCFIWLIITFKYWESNWNRKTGKLSFPNLSGNITYFSLHLIDRVIRVHFHKWKSSTCKNFFYANDCRIVIIDLIYTWNIILPWIE